jgi:hypothetical protein
MKARPLAGFFICDGVQQAYPDAGYESTPDHSQVRDCVLIEHPHMKRLLLWCAASLLFANLTDTAWSQSRVLVENFRNVNCGNCREPDIQFEEWVHQMEGTIGVDVIYVHNEITDINDPFYKESKGDVDFRDNEIYKVGSNPRVFVQGYDAGDQLGDWKTYVQAAAAQPRPVAISISEVKSLGNNQYSFKANIQNNSGRPMAIYAALLESGIVYDNPKLYLNPPSGVWDNIFRKMLPDEDGSDPMTGSAEMTFTFDLTGKTWNIENMKAIVFAQSITAEQGAPTSYLIGGHAVQEFSFGSVDPSVASRFSMKSVVNPTAGSPKIELRTKGHSHVRVDLIEMTGKKIETLVDNAMPEGLYIIGSQKELVAGTYLLNAYSDGQFAGQIKIVKQ